jgi:hypothetical protein
MWPFERKRLCTTGINEEILSFITVSIIRGIIPLMMEAEMVSETLGFYPQLIWLVAREYFIRITSFDWRNSK